MQDHHLKIVLEAMRRAQAKIAFYSEPGNGNPQKAFAELAEILDARDVVKALRSLQTSAPSVVPDGPAASPEQALQKALPGS